MSEVSPDRGWLQVEFHNRHFGDKITMPCTAQGAPPIKESQQLQGSSFHNVHSGANFMTFSKKEVKIHHGPKDREINLFVYWEKRPMGVRVRLHQKIEHIRKVVEGRAQVPVGEQSLVFRGKQMEDEFKVYGYNLQEGSNIFLTVRGRAGAVGDGGDPGPGGAKPFQGQGLGKGPPKGFPKGGGKGGAKGGAGAPAGESDGKGGYWQGMREGMAMGGEEGEEAAAKRAADRAFAEAMRAAIPEGRARDQATHLIQEEFSAVTCLARELGPRGGVAPCAKAELPATVARVGVTRAPTAIVTSEPAHALYMRGYTCHRVFVTLRVLGEEGPEFVQKWRFLIQLGGGEPVKFYTEGMPEVREVHTLTKCNIKFHPKGGWDTNRITGFLVADYLKCHLNEYQYENIVVREDGSGTATVLVYTPQVLSLLRQGGKQHIYVKPNIAELQFGDIEILFLPETFTHGEALHLNEQEAAALGVIMKSSSVQTQYGLRFQDLAKMAELAQKLGVPADFARFKLTGLHEATGIAGVFQIMKEAGWALEEVVYVGEGQAVAHSLVAPGSNRLALRRSDGLVTPVRIEAVNQLARKLCKEKNIESGRQRSAALLNPQAPATGVEERGKKAAEERAKRIALQKSMADSFAPARSTRPREPTMKTPGRETKPRGAEPVGKKTGGAPPTALFSGGGPPPRGSGGSSMEGVSGAADGVQGTG